MITLPDLTDPRPLLLFIVTTYLLKCIFFNLQLKFCKWLFIFRRFNRIAHRENPNCALVLLDSISKYLVLAANAGKAHEKSRNTVRIREGRIELNNLKNADII